MKVLIQFQIKLSERTMRNICAICGDKQEATFLCAKFCTRSSKICINWSKWSCISHHHKQTMTVFANLAQPPIAMKVIQTRGITKIKNKKHWTMSLLVEHSFLQPWSRCVTLLFQVSEIWILFLFSFSFFPFSLSVISWRAKICSCGSFNLTH